MVPRQVVDFLETERVAYEVLTHEKAYTAQGVAASLHVRGRDFAKAIVLKARDGRPLMAVIPGPRHVDLGALGKLVGSPVEMASEEEFAALFPGCELGAEPPFGSLYKLPVYLDESLLEDREIVCNAGSHTEAIRMKRVDFERLVHPIVARLSTAH